MSLLTPQEPNEAMMLERRVTQIKNSPRQMTEMLVRQWMSAFDALWSTGKFTPQQKLEELGTDAAELFELNTAMVTFMVSQLTGKRDDLVQMVTEKVAQIPEHTVHEDGTVTINE